MGKDDRRDLSITGEGFNLFGNSPERIERELLIVITFDAAIVQVFFLSDLSSRAVFSMHARKARRVSRDGVSSQRLQR